VTIRTSGTGDATFYLVGPVSRVKRQVKLGEHIILEGEHIRQAGPYVAILRAGGGTITKGFSAKPAAIAQINFLAQPSRVAAGAPQAISGTAFVMDQYRNLVLTPTTVQFDLSVEGGTANKRVVTSRDGVAWTRMDSGRRAGNAQFTASSGPVSVKRVVQQTASDPCNLRIYARPGKNGVAIETDPVRDCSGNPVPDGIIVTFTAIDPKGKSTIDARVKRGVARAELPVAPGATISAASGVVIGNEIRWGGGR
jgi:hypothetical protein